MSYASRHSEAIDRIGETLTIGGTVCKVAVDICDSTTLRKLFDDVEVMAVVKPALLIVAKADSTIAATQTFTRDARTFTVRRVAIQRLAGEAVCKLAVAW